MWPTVNNFFFRFRWEWLHCTHADLNFVYIDTKANRFFSSCVFLHLQQSWTHFLKFQKIILNLKNLGKFRPTLTWLVPAGRWRASPGRSLGHCDWLKQRRRDWLMETRAECDWCEWDHCCLLSGDGAERQRARDYEWMNEYKNNRDGSDAERRIHKPRTPESFLGFKAHRNVFFRIELCWEGK